MTVKHACRRCGATFDDTQRRTPIHNGRHGLVCPGSGQPALIVKDEAAEPPVRAHRAA